MSRPIVALIAIISFGLGAVVGVLGYVTVTGGSGEASRDVNEVVRDLAATATPESSAAETAATEEPAATPEPAAETEATEAMAVEAALVVFRIAQEGSEARFKIDEDLRGQRITVVGVTNQVAGEISVDLSNPANSSIGPLVINARTLATDNPFRNNALRGQILRSSDAAYEFITFVPTSIEGLPAAAAPGDAITFQVTGDLKIIETTRPVTFEVSATLSEDGQTVNGSASAVVRYADFNLRIPSVQGVANISVEVVLEIDFSATRAEG